MKRFLRIVANIMSILIIGVFCFSSTACSDIRKMEITVSVYSEEENALVEKTLTLDLYRHLAPETVDAIISYAKAGHYNNSIFYQSSFYLPHIYVGELKDIDGEIVVNEVKPEITGEFDLNGVKGSNLQNTEGSVGLWRSWVTGEKYSTTNFDSFNSGRSTWYMPTSASDDEDGFCVFAQFDTTSEAWTLIKALLSNPEHYQSYTIYYTGTYISEDVDDDGNVINHGLTFHCLPTADFDNLPTSEKDKVFKASTEQLVCYNAMEINVPVYQNGGAESIGAKIVSVKV